MKRLSVICFICFFLLTSSWCFASTVVFNTLDFASSNLVVATGYTRGSEFSPSETVKLDTIITDIQTYQGIGATIFSLYTDNGGSMGTLLESWRIESNTLYKWHEAQRLTTLTSVTQSILLVGENYWLIAAAEDDSSWDWWAMSGIYGNCYQNGTYSYSLLDAFKVQGSSIVPIPAAFWLLGSGLVGLVGMRRRIASKIG